MVITVSFLFYLTYERMCFKIKSLKKKEAELWQTNFMPRDRETTVISRTWKFSISTLGMVKVAFSRCRFTKPQKENTICMVPVLAVHRMVC